MYLKSEIRIQIAAVNDPVTDLMNKMIQNTHEALVAKTSETSSQSKYS